MRHRNERPIMRASPLLGSSSYFCNRATFSVGGAHVATAQFQKENRGPYLLTRNVGATVGALAVVPLGPLVPTLFSFA
jgi:hypothetical protein